MKKSISIITVSLVSMLLAFPALADRGGWHHGDRDHRFERRIDRGWDSGELTRHELRKLERKLGKINRLEHRFWKDGRLSRDERQVLRKKRKHLSQAIYRMKHNDNRAGHRYRDHDDRWYFSFDYYDS